MLKLKEIYQKLVEIRQKKKSLQEEIENLKRKAFGEVSDEENIAKRFFSELAISSDEVEGVERELQEKKRLLNDAEREEKEVRDAFLKALTTLKFPLKVGSEGIERSGNKIIFHFDQTIEKGIFDEISSCIGKDWLSSENVEIHCDKIVAKNFEKVTDAMAAVLDHVENKIWKAASGMLKIEELVIKLRSRDEKIQKMLYVLYKADKPLTKIEIERKANLQPGDLRGVLYLVLRRDPYLLKKVGKGQFSLTEFGKKVMERYDQTYGSPLVEEKKDTVKSLINFTKSGGGMEN